MTDIGPTVFRFPWFEQYTAKLIKSKFVASWIACKAMFKQMDKHFGIHFSSVIIHTYTYTYAYAKLVLVATIEIPKLWYPTKKLK